MCKFLKTYVSARKYEGMSIEQRVLGRMLLDYYDKQLIIETGIHFIQYIRLTFLQWVAEIR